MSSEENYIELEGEVFSICRDKFTVHIKNEHSDQPMVVVCTCSGKMRTAGIRIIAGDMCRVMVSAHDPTKGRIVYRMKI